VPSRLLFADPLSAADALTFARRAVRLGDGNVRLRAEGGVLALSAAPLAPASLLDDTPTVLGMRFLAVDPELVCDLVVEAASLTRDEASPNAVELPETGQTAPWAGISPPRGGWTDAGAIPAATLAARAQWGIAAVAQAVPTDAGEDAVRAVRARIWGPDDDELDGAPLGVAFAAFALGFIAGEEIATVRRSGPWTRVSLARGHVLTRSTVRSGLTSVRSTGIGG
jgi:hypothetical protein